MTYSTTALVPMLAIGQTLLFIACGMIALGLLAIHILVWWRVRGENKNE